MKQDYFYQSNLPGRGYGTFFNGSALVGEICILINGLPILEEFHYKEHSLKFALPEGECQIDVYHGDKWIGSAQFFIEKERNYFIAVTGLHGKADVIACALYDHVPRGEAAARFIHLASSHQELDISVHKGDVVFPSLQYCGVSDVLALTPAYYNLEARMAGTKTIILPMHDAVFEKNQAYLVCIAQGESASEAVFIPY
ncbi:DUF4397 domain-containing protein [Bacillus sp. EB01]|uniref:DUF4397 domain-containing protein n=1 Tax=Bacillus sp. EB01 TaxID=1347086 RepID=UPI0005C5A954|nr:DUF4397 domain-containing protein [Bacillus sp. EB01]